MAEVQQAIDNATLQTILNEEYDRALTEGISASEGAGADEGLKSLADGQKFEIVRLADILRIEHGLDIRIHNRPAEAWRKPIPSETTRQQP